MDKLQKIIDLQNQVTSIDQSVSWRWGLCISIALIGLVVVALGIGITFDGDGALGFPLIICGLGIIAVIAIPITYQIGHQHTYDNAKATIDVLKFQMAGSK